MKYQALVFMALLFGMAIQAPAEVIQTDWSGGNGETGPVTEWGSRFDTAQNISWLSIPGQTCLASATLTPPVENFVDNAYGSFGLDTADIDNDGDIDVLGGAGGSGNIHLWLNNNDQPLTWTEQIIDDAFPGAGAVLPADIDGDGHLDVVATAVSPGDRIAWWRNGGGDPISWTRQDIITGFTSSYELFAADVDRDEDIDIVCGSWSDGFVVWLRNDGGDPISWTPVGIDNACAGAHSTVVEDMDGDGDNDIVGAAGIDNQIILWRNDGNDPIVWTKLILRENFIGARSVRVADFNNDGRPDITGTSWDRHVIWLRNDGGDPLQWTEQVIDANFPGGHSIYTSDVNGDGRIDIMAAGVNNHQITWWENSGGDPITWIEHIVTNDYTNAITIRANDIDGDGDIDILGASYYWNKYNWWEVTEFQSSGEIKSSILDTQAYPQALRLNWISVEPTGTELCFQMRGSDDPGNMGDWSDDIISPGYVIDPIGRYVQYRALFETTVPRFSPILYELECETDVDISDAPTVEPTGVIRLSCAPNPSPGATRLDFTIGATAFVTVNIYDMTGRLVRKLASREYSSGRHHLRAENLPAGIFFCRLQSGDYSIKRRIVIAE